jgi:hypothetical protein
MATLVQPLHSNTTLGHGTAGTDALDLAEMGTSGLVGRIFLGGRRQRTNGRRADGVTFGASVACKPLTTEGGKNTDGACPVP